MSFLRNVYADLVDKRLLPVAALLLIALVAIPVLLSKPTKESGSTDAPAGVSALLGGDSAALLGETKPAVSLGGEGSFRKHVARLSRKNPFKQQALGATRARDEGVTVQDGATTGTDTAGQVPGTTVPDSTPDTGTGDGTRKLYRYVAEVKFGRIGKTKKENVEPAEFMPSEQNPVLLFLGADNAGENALFLVSPEATSRGDGVCVPDESKCEIVRLKQDDVQFFEVSLSAETVVTYELELVDIALKEVKSSPSTSVTEPSLGPDLNTRRLKRMRQAMRTKRVFKALDQLGF
jgi:hypothetical protein